MPDNPPIEQSIAPGDEIFDPAQLDDAGLQAFLGLTEPTPDNPDVVENEEAEGDAAADKALESALAEPVKAEQAKAAPAADVVKPVEKVEAQKEEPTGAAPKEPEKKSLYVAYGADGQPLSEIPIKEIELTVNGSKKRVDLDKLARMASSGGYNEQLQEEVKQARALAQRAQELEAHARALAEERESILKDPDFYLKRVEEYAEAQSPEARATRAEKKLQDVQTQTQAQQAALYVEQQANEVMLPKLSTILEQHPLVTEQEVLQQFETLIRPYRGPHGGMIDPRAVPTILDVIDRAIAPWAAQLHDARDETEKAKAATAAATKATEKATATTKQANASATKAKAQVSRTLAPVGRVAARPTQPKAPAKTANEGADRALDDALEFILNQNNQAS